MTDLDGSVPPDSQVWSLRLYVAGQSPKSLQAVANLKRFCDEHLNGRSVVEIVDLVEDPARAKGDGILAIPTLVRREPRPLCRLIGDLSNTARLLAGLQVEVRPT